MSADLERKVREAAEQALDKKRSLLEWTDNAYLYGDGYRDGYLAAATLREKEIATLRARVEELEGMVPKWCEWDSDERRDLAKAGAVGIGDDELIGGKWHRSSTASRAST